MRPLLTSLKTGVLRLCSALLVEHPKFCASMERERPFCQEKSGGMNCWPISQAIPVDDKSSLLLFIWCRPLAGMECLFWSSRRIGRRWRVGQPRKGKRGSENIAGSTIERVWTAFLPPWLSTRRKSEETLLRLVAIVLLTVAGAESIDVLACVQREERGRADQYRLGEDDSIAYERSAEPQVIIIRMLP